MSARRTKGSTGRKGKKKATPRQRLLGILLGIAFVIGFGILIYPTVSNQWNTWRQSRLVTSYNNAVSEMVPEDLTAYWEAAEEYNESLSGFSIYVDAFSDDDGDADSGLESSPYWNVLNVNGDGIMGYIVIPKINIHLPIYHGTSDEVLEHGIGHLESSQLPIGGEGNHAVLAGHRGLPSARLFTDLDQMETGDRFYLYILDDILAYQVDQILPMVEKDDYDTLEEALAPVEGEDYVTLFTCTPYGVNTHRLLVRGHRVPYNGELDESTPMDAVLQAIRDYYMLYVLLGIAIVLLLILLLRGILHRRDARRGKR